MLHKTYTKMKLVSLWSGITLKTVNICEHLGFLHPSVEGLEVSKISSN